MFKFKRRNKTKELTDRDKKLIEDYNKGKILQMNNEVNNIKFFKELELTDG